MEEFLSQERRTETRRVLGQEIAYWTSPALNFGVAADNDKLGGGGLRIGATAGPVTIGKEGFNRKVQEVVRGEQANYQLWGVAIDASLEITDEVGTAVPFIMATFLVVLVVVGISLRSVRVVLLTALGLAAMIIWLKGLSNLVGLNSSTTLDFIVPIAMISLGADFVIHAVNRYREERALVSEPRRAFTIGMAGVLGALVLAMVTDAIAFLSNASAGIETVIGFGIGAGLAIFAAFIIMGLTVPLALMRLDDRRQKKNPSTDESASTPVIAASGPRAALASLVVSLARHRWVVIPVTVGLTAVAGYYAFQLEATFDVKDFFKSDSDFAVGLDKIDVHIGEAGGEPAIVYLEGDMSDPQALATIAEFVERLRSNPYVATTADGEVVIQSRTVFNVLDQVLRSEYAVAQIETDSGVSLLDGVIEEFQYGERIYRRPGSTQQLRAIYAYISADISQMESSAFINIPS